MIQHTTFCGFPARNAAIFASSMLRSLSLVSFGAHAMCGVIMQFGALYSGHEGDIGSCSITSAAYPAIDVLSSAFLTAASSTRPPRAQLTITADFFIIDKVFSFTIFAVSLVIGAWSVRKSD